MESISDCEQQKSMKIGFIGGGNIAKAIFDGIIKKKIVNADRICVSGPHIENLTHFKERGAFVHVENGKILELCKIVFICVKPHLLNDVFNSLQEHQKHFSGTIIVSVLAGTSLDKIESTIKLAFRRTCDSIDSKLVRVMPNTAMAIGEGCSVFSCKNLNESEVQIVKALLDSCGLCLQVPESQINAIAAVSGSGPAFMYTILEAMADGAVKMGIPRKTAIELATQTMIGAAKMVQASSKHSAQLKDEVCSAGGTTIVGMHTLEKGGLRGVIIDAIENTTKKAFEMDNASRT